MLTAAVVGLALGGCGEETVDAKSAENFIRKQVHSHGVAKVKSVSCPSNVEAKNGTDFKCELTLTDAATGSMRRSGTITLHITGGGEKLQTYGNKDIDVR